MKKYILTENKREINGIVLYQIQATRSFGIVKRGDLGGWIEKEENLSQDGLAWVNDHAIVCENAQIYGDAYIYGHARAYGNARIFGHARVFENACIYGNAMVSDTASVFGNSRIYENACIYENSSSRGNCCVYENASLFGNAHLLGDVVIRGDAKIYGGSIIFGNARVAGNAKIDSSEHIVWISNVGSPNGVLTAYLTKEKKVEILTRDFQGSIKEFKKTIKEKKVNKEIAKEYLALMDFINVRFKKIN